ncbi:MAG: hypothetical protein AAGI52_07315 [Bacteroidota bacterium]
MKATLLAMATLVGACATPEPQPPNMSPGGPAVEVFQEPGEPVRLFWQPSRALSVEIRHAETGRVVWRASAGINRFGPQGALLAAPLAVAPMGLPLGVNPPNGRGAEASVPELERGERYTVTVAPCTPSRDETACAEIDPLETTFTARATTGTETTGTE